jgi:diguanylate cyclase (GGDEF)-like protein/PAS domain S-box-containing protein
MDWGRPVLKSSLSSQSRTPHAPAQRADALRADALRSDAVRADAPRGVTAGVEEAELYRAAFHRAPLAMAVLDDVGRFARVNDALCTLVGHTADELLGRPYESVAYPEGPPAPAGHAPHAASDERELRHRDGHTVWARVAARPLAGPDGTGTWTVCVWEDVDEHRRTHERLARLALHDPLTGVANRALLDDRLSQALRARDRDGGVVAVLFCDVDSFKAVNDEFGHRFGDDLLGVVAARLTSAVRSGDTVARVGGDEFVIVSLLHETSDADMLLLRVGEALGDAIRDPGGCGMPLSVSVGMAIADTAGCTAADLLDRADRQMYAVKRRRLPAEGG